jgi:hypothetical protein
MEAFPWPFRVEHGAKRKQIRSRVDLFPHGLLRGHVGNGADCRAWPTIAETQKLLAGGETVLFENRYRCKDGSYKWLQWTAITAFDHQRIYAAARDVTERKRSLECLKGKRSTLSLGYRCYAGWNCPS